MIKKSRKWHIQLITQEDFDKKELIKNLFIGELHISKLFAYDFNSYGVLDTICCMPKSIIEEHCFGKNYNIILWNARLLLAQVHNAPMTMTQEFYFYIFIKMSEDDKEIMFLLIFLESIFIKKNRNSIPILEGLETIKHLLKLKHYDRNIIYSLQPSITKYWKKIARNLGDNSETFKIEYKKLNCVDVLSIYNDIDVNELPIYVGNPANLLNNESSVKILMNQLFLFTDSNTTEKLQALFSFSEIGSYLQEKSISHVSLDFLYKPVGDTIIFLLANQSLSSKEHFVDIFWKKKMKYFITHFLDEKDSLPQNRHLEYLYPFLFVACFEQILQKKDSFCALEIELFQKNADKYLQTTEAIRYKIKQIKDLIQSVENDNTIINEIYNHLGKKYSIESLATNSIPFLLQEIIFKCDQSLLSLIFNTQSYLISEYDMGNSESFLYAPTIYCSVINYVVGNEKELPDLNDYKKHFKIPEIREKIFYDIFSLIFLKNKMGEFYCDIEKAEMILNCITVFFTTNGNMPQKEQNLIKTSRQHLIFAKLNQKKSDLQSAIFSYDNYLINCIVNNEFKTVETLAPSLGSPKLKAIVQMLSYYRDPKTKTIEDKYKFNFAVECFLSTNDIKDWLIDQELIDLQNYFSDIMLISLKNLIDLHHLYDNPISLYRKKQNLIHTTAFEAYKKLYSKFENIIMKNTNNGFDPNKRLEPSEIIRILHENDIEANMDNLVTLLGNHALEFLLLYTPSYNEKIYKLVENESPITAQAIRYEFATKGNYKPGNTDTVYERLLAKKAGYSEDEEFEIISTDFDAMLDSHDSSLAKLSNEEVNELIDKYAIMSPLPIDILNSIYIRSPVVYNEKMKNIIRNDLQRFTVSDLLDLYPFCGMKSLPLLERLKVTIIDAKSIIYLLMEKTRWLTLRLFLEDLKELYGVKSKNEEEEEEERLFEMISSYIKTHPETIQVVPRVILNKIEIDQFMKINQRDNSKPSFHIESISDLNYYLERSNESFEVSETIQMIDHLLQPLVIDNNFREFIQRQIHKLSILFSRRFKHSFSTKLRALSSMLSRDLLGRYGIVISLANFSSDSFGSHVALIHLKYDFFKECQEICAAWSLDLSFYKAEMALSAFKLGLADEGVNLISPPIRNDALVDQIVDILSNKFIIDLTPIMAASDPIEKIKVAMTFGNRWINIHLPVSTEQLELEEPQDDEPLIINLPPSDTILYPESPQIKILHKVLMELNNVDKLIMFYASKGYFEYAFDVWNTIKRRSTKSELFIRSIVFPALIFQNWQLLWSKVRKMYDTEKSGENQMKGFVLDLFKFLHQRQMGYTAYNIQMSLNLYQMAFDTANNYFMAMKSWEGQLKIIDAMRKALKRIKDVKKDVNAKLDFEVNYIIQPCIKQNIPFNNALNIMTTKKNAILTAVFLVKRGEVDTVMLKLLPMLLFTLDEMNHALLDDAMMQGEIGIAMHNLFVQLEKANQQNYEAIIMNLFQAISKRVNDTNSLSKFIDENVRDSLKGQVLITFGFFNLAYNCAVKTHDIYLMQLIKENAEKKGDKALYDKANNYLQKQNKD